MIKLILAVSMAVIICAPAGAALFDGKVVNYQYFYPFLSNAYPDAANGNYTVGPGVEVPNIADSTGTLDISDTNLLIEFIRSDYMGGGNFPGFFNGFRIQDVNNSIGDFTSVSINAITNMTGFDLSMITFDGNNIWVNWAGTSFNSETIVSLNVNGGSAPVPEPATMLLLGIGMIGLAGYGRKKLS